MKEIYVRTKLVNGTYVYAPKGTKDTYGTVLIDNDTLKYDDNNKLKVDISVINAKLNDETLKEIDKKLDKKLDKTAVVQETGNSTTNVMSQNAVRENFAWLVDGKVPASQLPSYVDDVLEYDSKNDFPEPGETGKIYVDKSTNLTYRWSGSTYIQVGGGDLNLENGTGTGSLVQTNVVSSSGTPYTNWATGSGAVAFGKGCRSTGNTAFTIGQQNKTGNYSGTGDSDSGKGGFTHGYNNINEGHYTEVGGSGNTVYYKGADTIVNGRNNTILKSNHSAVFGDTNKVDGTYNPNNGANDNIVGGKNNNVGSSGNIVGGESNTANGNNNSLIVGSHNNINTNFSGDRIVGGHYNNPVANALMEIGNGTSDTDRKNAFEVLEDGRAKVQSAPVDNNDVVRKLELDKKLTAPTIPTETSFVTVSSTGTSAYKKVSELVDTTSEQTITGTKNFESTGKNFCITCQTIIKGVTYTAKISGGDLLFINDGGSENIQANYGINGVYSRHRTSSSSGLLKLPIDIEGTFAITPNAAPTEPSFIVTAADRTPTWKPVSELDVNALKVTVW